MRSVLFFSFIFLIAASCQQKSAESQNKTETPQVTQQPTNRTADAKTKDRASWIKADRAIKLIENKGYTAIDVRTPEEIAEGKIGNAIEIDFRADNFKDEIGKLDKSGSYIVYCASGGRSKKATDMMLEMGFTDFYDLVGGYSSYEHEMKKAAN